MTSVSPGSGHFLLAILANVLPHLDRQTFRSHTYSLHKLRTGGIHYGFLAGSGCAGNLSFGTAGTGRYVCGGLC